VLSGAAIRLPPLCSLLTVLPQHPAKIYLVKYAGFFLPMFRRAACDETIFLATKPFFAFQADVPKPSLTTNGSTKRRP
jgi:hypothetical protein